VYRFALRLADGAVTGGGCFATARFDFVDGPLPGTTLEILGNDSVFFANGSNEVVDADTLELYEPEDVRLTTRDGRIFELDLALGVTRLEDLNGNHLTITPSGITHSSGVGIDFERDEDGRIVEIVDTMNRVMTYGYDANGDLLSFSDRAGNVARFIYDGEHRLLEVEDPRGVKPLRNDYDDEGRLIRHTDVFGKVITYEHQLSANTEVVTDRLGNSRSFEYDGRGNVIRQVDVLGGEIQRAFDERDNLLTETTALGQGTSYTYDEFGNLTSVTDPLDHTTAYTHDASGRVLTVTDPLGRVTANVYDPAGNLLRTTDPSRAVTSWVYDAAGNHLSRTDAAGNITSFAYDSHGRLLSRIDALGTETTYTYDAAGNRLSETSIRTLPDGTTETLSTQQVYDALDRSKQTIHADGGTTGAAYDALGQVTELSGSLGQNTSYSYDELGRQTAVSYPGGGTQTTTFDAEGRVISVTDPAGRITSYVYDPAGRLVRTTFPDGAVSRNAYDLAGRLVSTTDPRGNVTSYEYNAAGRRVRVIDAAGAQTDFVYDPASRLVSITGPNRQTTSFTYDAADRRVNTTFADGTTHVVSYDEIGRRIAETDQAGKTTRFDYDALGRLITVTDVLGQITSYTYDEAGNRLTQTDANGHATRFEYDASGRRTARVLPDGARESMEYDEAGNLISKIDFQGRTTSFSYDPAGRLVSKSLPGGATVGYAYSATRRLSSVTDARGTTLFTYDARGRLASKTTPDGRKLSYGYDAAGNRTSTTAEVAGQTLTTAYSYDALDRLTSVTDPEGRVYTHTFDAAGNRISQTYPNGVVTTYDYDALRRPTGVTAVNPAAAETIASFVYTLGPAGNRTRIDELGGVSRAYGYDNLYRLGAVTIEDPEGVVYTKSFGYDPAGNRLVQNHTAGGATASTSYGYDERDRILAAAGEGFTWDANGTLTSAGDGASSYTWDPEGRLLSATLADGTVVNYGYDAMGERVRTEATAPDGSTQVTGYLVDTQGPISQVVAETDGEGELQAYYVRGLDLLAAVRPSETRYYHADALGSARALTDETGEVTDRYAFSAFGELEVHEGEDLNVFLFAGEAWDPDSGFYYLRARWMDPSLGRFVSADPFEGFPTYPGTLHRYLYAGNDPVNNFDPSGRFFTVGLIGLTVSAAVSNLLATAMVPWTRPPAVPVRLRPLIVGPSRWDEEKIEEHHLGFARKVFAEHRIFLSWTQVREASLNGVPFVRSSFKLDEVDSLIVLMHRRNTTTLPLLFINAILDQSGILFDRDRWGRTYSYPTCENAESRGSAITTFALFSGVVTAHELGHAIGCLPHKVAAHGWGPEWLMRDIGAQGTKLDASERILLRRNVRGIPDGFNKN
jgi:RHS repeat-associated protein